MTQMSSSVLILDHPQADAINFGADFEGTNPQLPDTIEAQKYAVVVCPISAKNQKIHQKTLEKLKTINPEVQAVLIEDKATMEVLSDYVNFAQPYRILKNYSDEKFDLYIQQSLEEYDRLQQNQTLINLVNDQNEKLKELKQELEDRVQKRQKYLQSAQSRLKSTNEKIEYMHKATLSIHRAQSVGEMEKNLNQVLAKFMKIVWTKIDFTHSSSLNEKEEVSHSFNVFSTPLMTGNITLGSFHVGRDKGAKFQKDDQEFLHQLSEVISLAIDRLSKIEQAEQLKQQWEATFDSISDPLCLTDDQFRILRTNQSFVDKVGVAAGELLQQSAFKTILNSEVPEEVTQQKPSPYILKTQHFDEPTNELTYLTIHQVIRDQESLTPLIHMFIFKDITEQSRIEKQLLQSAKMAELGIIGSSIAHELNNPLAGMISFLQIIKMDLAPDHPIYEDILYMESASQKCKEIIENLLGFSRQHADEMETIDLRDVIQSSLKIIEIQTRSKGIETKIQLPKKPIVVNGNANQLTQAIRNILQNSFEAIERKMLQDPRYKGLIDIHLKTNRKEIQLVITDNGDGIEEENLSKIFNPLFSTKEAGLNSGLGLTVAFGIIKEHEGKLEIYSQPNRNTTAMISLKRPDLKAKSQVFDSKI